MTPNPDLDPRYAAVPFVPLIPGLKTLDDLMSFDRQTARVFRQFRRPVHHADTPAEVATKFGTPTTGQVLVTSFGPGIRSRLFIG